MQDVNDFGVPATVWLGLVIVSGFGVAHREGSGSASVIRSVESNVVSLTSAFGV